VIPRQPEAGIFKEELMEKSVTLYLGDEPIGRTLAREEFAQLEPGEVYDAIKECAVAFDKSAPVGTWAIIYLRPDGKVGIED
jgi:hypothetical protein